MFHRLGRPVRLAVVLAGFWLGFSSCSPASPSPAPGTGASRSAEPDYAAMGDAIDGFLSSGTVAFKNVQGVLVSVDGKEVVRHERTAGAASRRVHVWSVAKSFLSTLIGIAIDDGLISGVDAKVSDLLPRHRGDTTPAMAAVTLRQLLTMSAGCPPDPDVLWPTMNAHRNAVTAILRACRPNGDSAFVYSSTDTHLVAAILVDALGRPGRATSGMSILDYARVKLFDPLKINTRPAYEGIGTTTKDSDRIENADPDSAFAKADFAWATDRQGVHSGCCLMRLSAADLLKLGELYLQEGTWQGRRIVSPAWVQAASSEQVPGYGFLWWMTLVDTDPAYAARGSHGQLIVVVPSRKLVVAVASQQDPDYHLGPYDLDSLVNNVIVPQLKR